jgi:hypothetical protein
VTQNAVPYIVAAVYTESGQRAHREWVETWRYQVLEDQGRATDHKVAPPQYVPEDFCQHYYAHRGKLDVPKESFISYPGCQKDGDDSPLIGWAGWNHLQRAQVLIALYQERKLEDGWPKERLMPMLVGLHELMFWLELWHSKPEAGSENPAREIRQYLDAELNAHRLTTDDLEAWRPESRKATNARKRNAKTAP